MIVETATGMAPQVESESTTHEVDPFDSWPISSEIKLWTFTQKRKHTSPVLLRRCVATKTEKAELDMKNKDNVQKITTSVMKYKAPERESGHEILSLVQ